LTIAHCRLTIESRSVKEKSQRLVASAIPASLAGAALMAPYLATAGYSLSALAVGWFFSPVCHQDPARSFWIFGAPIAICARCLGIYLGAAAGAWMGWSRRAAVGLLALAAAINGLDVATEWAGLHGNWLGVRFALGLSLGVGMAAVVAAALEARGPSTRAQSHALLRARSG
jgi:uncharacterized membrane protein